MASSKVDSSYMKELLTCAVCLELVREPMTLTQCLHHYCKACVDELMTQSNPTEHKGALCPLCRKFTVANDIKENHFVKELVSLHVMTESTGDGMNIACEKCDDQNSASPSAWRCVDCRSYICHVCKTQHSKFIKGHRVLEMTEETKVTIDHLLFCDIHTEEPLRFYCNDCKQIICINCQVVTHRNHDIVTIEDALKRMLPDVKQFVGDLVLKQHKVEEGIGKCEMGEMEIRKTFEQKRLELKEKANKRVEEIRKEEKHMEVKLIMEEEKQIKEINEKKDQLVNHQKEIINLKHVGFASVDKAKHLSLLSELVQGGLYVKLQKMTLEPLPNMDVNFRDVGILYNDDEWRKFAEAGLLGGFDKEKPLVCQLYGKATVRRKIKKHVRERQYKFENDEIYFK